MGRPEEKTMERNMNIEIYRAASAAGRAAGQAHSPTPMGVYPVDLRGNRLGPTEVVEDGVCGFAWVKIAGNTSFGRWAKKEGIARSAYGGGLQIWISDYGQSMERKEAHARAMAKVLNNNGVKAYAQSRMD